jgi:hypothetical protein
MTAHIVAAVSVWYTQGTGRMRRRLVALRRWGRDRARGRVGSPSRRHEPLRAASGVTVPMYALVLSATAFPFPASGSDGGSESLMETRSLGPRARTPSMKRPGDPAPRALGDDSSSLASSAQERRDGDPSSIDEGEGGQRGSCYVHSSLQSSHTFPPSRVCSEDFRKQQLAQGFIYIYKD